MVDSYQERLALAMKNAEVSVAQLAKEVGITYQAVKAVVDGKSAGFGIINNVRVAAALKVNSDWLATGDGNMLAKHYVIEGAPGHYTINGQPAEMVVTRAPQPVELSDNPDYPAIRRVRLKAQAGVTGFAVEFMDEDGPPIVFRKDWYAQNGYQPNKMIALRVSGESMSPSLYPGDLIVANTAQTDPKDGIAFVAAYEGEIVVKRLVRDAGQWWLTSDNPDQRRYPRKVCDEHTQIIGEVVYRQTERI